VTQRHVAEGNPNVIIIIIRHEIGLDRPVSAYTTYICLAQVNGQILPFY
jgi:hypothetical protein